MTMNNNKIALSYQIAKLTILLGMVCHGSKRERLKGKQLLHIELESTYPLLELNQIRSISEWLSLSEHLFSPQGQLSLGLNPIPDDLSDVLEELNSIDSFVFRHPFRTAEEILTELYIYSSAVLVSNPLIRSCCKTASNYYLDNSGTSTILFKKAREALRIEKHDIDRWFSHKGWVLFLESESVATKKQPKNKSRV
jgi:hypothetical protein